MSSPAHSSSPLQFITQKAVEQEKRFQELYPELYKQMLAENFLKNQTSTQNDDTNNVTSSPPVSLGAQQMFSQVTAEEHAEVLQKARSIVQLPAGNLDRELSLYLEQQLSEILGFSITAKLENMTLPHTHGTVAALSHIKRTPTDTLSEHQYQYASFSNKRSYFGWLNTGLGAQHDGMQAEQYGISLPLFTLPDWQTQAATLTKWYAFRKVVLINPTELVAVVARITDAFSVLTNQYQFGASPETIVAGKCWSQSSGGKVLLFFIDDSSQDIPLGPVSLQFQGKA